MTRQSLFTNWLSVATLTCLCVALAGCAGSDSEQQKADSVASNSTTAGEGAAEEPMFADTDDFAESNDGAAEEDAVGKHGFLRK